jgi:formate-dependent nitrite reductase membrane component NrfD
VIFLATAEHFVRAPQWTWFILGYFFFAGLTGGSYAIATLLRLAGDPRDEAAARIGFYVSFLTLLACPVLLTVDLGAGWSRFWHMLVNVTPGDLSLSFKYWSPMSVGAWALFVFGVFAFVSALESFILDRRPDSAARPIGGPVGLLFNVVGGILALFLASYTGVLLSVSNQPVWSDTWALGGLFLASGLGGATALIAWLTRYRPEAAFSLVRLHVAGGYFAILELILLVVFFVTISFAGTASRTIGLLPLWALALVGIASALVGARGRARLQAAGGAAAVTRTGVNTMIVALLVLIGVLALRAAVIFSGQ